MRAVCSVVAVLCIGIADPCRANTLFLSQDLGVHGLYHLCKYSNGQVYSYNATDLCPLSIEDDNPEMSNPSASGGETGFYSGEYQDGMTKVCVYNVLGYNESIRVSSVAICPQTYKF